MTNVVSLAHRIHTDGLEDKGDTIRDTAHKLMSFVDGQEAVCLCHGLTATGVRLVSAGDWTEPIGGLGPYEGVTLHIYEATAA